MRRRNEATCKNSQSVLGKMRQLHKAKSMVLKRQRRKQKNANEIVRDKRWNKSK